MASDLELAVYFYNTNGPWHTLIADVAQQALHWERTAGLTGLSPLEQKIRDHFRRILRDIFEESGNGEAIQSFITRMMDDPNMNWFKARVQRIQQGRY